jgi:oligopeptide transport system substrate-binding protein
MKSARQILLFSSLCLFLSKPYLALSEAGGGKSFSFHLMAEPQSLDPVVAQGSSGGYLVYNLYRGLFRYDSQKGLIGEGAKNCLKTKLKWTCRLNGDLRWSNGEKITASQYVQAFRRLIDPDSKSPQAEILLSLKNAPDILKGKKKITDLGVNAPDDSTLVILLEKEDPELGYKLALPAAAPVYQLPFPHEASKIVVNGPYRLQSWKKGRLMELRPNTFYSGNSGRPPVSVYFVDDDATALNLYLSGRLSFLRRLVTDKIESFRSRPDFYQVPMARFDYIGFGPRLKQDLKLRQALVQSLDYAQLGRLYHALGPPGCPSLSPRLQEQVFCHSFDQKKFRADFASAGALKNSRLVLAFSKMGGEDIQKGMEWVQHQWATHLGLKLELSPQEQSYYIRRLKNHDFDLFRKGVGLDRPTCLAALEIFLPSHPENYIQLEDKDYVQWVEKLASSRSGAESRRYCARAIQVLINKAYIIPLGEMNFTLLASPDFTGWSLNEMNQLDLSELKFSGRVSK